MQPPPLPSTAYRIVKCYNCSNLFDIITFQNHICEYDNKHTIIEISSSKKNQPACSAMEPKKSFSERLIMENQIRIRRYLKEELKYDIPAKLDVVSNKKGKSANECTMCDRKFVHASGLLRHLEKHTLDMIPTNVYSFLNFGQPVNGLRIVIICNNCGLVFYEATLAIEHMRVHYANETKMVVKIKNVDSSEDDSDLFKRLASTEALLDECGDPFDNICKDFELFDKHFQISITGSVLVCEFCDYQFVDIKKLLAHTATHIPERNYECTACDVHLSTVKDASNHFQTECGLIRENIKQLQVAVHRFFVCNVCENKFPTLAQLIDHRYMLQHFFPRLAKDKSKVILPCENCDTTFDRADDALAHFEDKHMNKKKRGKDIQNTNFTSSGRLRQYLCDICGKSYTQSSHLWQHLRFHQGVKPFVCQEANCGRKFTIRPDLNDHIRKCHTGERPYHCLVCGKRFLTGSVFYQHRLIHRGERRYECEECGKRFYRADALKNHQRIHTGEKPFSCLFCTKTFRQRGDRDKHIRARHSHLDANSRLMMQMQKFQLEAAAAAAAMKAKKLQEEGTNGNVTSSQVLDPQMSLPIRVSAGDVMPSYQAIAGSMDSGLPQQNGYAIEQYYEPLTMMHESQLAQYVALPTSPDRTKVVVLENQFY